MNTTESVFGDDCVVVVGSGPCGAMAAAELVRRGVNVVLLDAGIRGARGAVIRAAGNTIFRRMDQSMITADRHDLTTSPLVEWHSSLSLGGLSNYWTAAVPRFAPEDFTEGAALDERYVWPITYDDLVPYYERAETALVVTAGSPFPNFPPNRARYSHQLPMDWQSVAEQARSHGLFLGSLPMAKGTPWMTAGRGTEFDSYHCIIASLLESPHFVLVAGAYVTRLVWSSREGRVEAVEYVDRARRLRVQTRVRAVVVAAGAIDSTTLLLRSTSADFPDGLGNSAGLIGRYLHDHPKEWWPATSGVRMTALAHPAYLSRGPYDRDAPLMATSLTIGLASRRQRLRTYVRARTDSFGVQVFGTMVPTSDIGVAVPHERKRDPVECRPRLMLSYDQAALDNLADGRRRLRELFAPSGIEVDVAEHDHPIVPGQSVHYAGSVRMHSSPEFGALNSSNRMYDVPNVIVCDSSCFTTGPEKNPTLTAMAIAARAADRLADDLVGE